MVSAPALAATELHLQPSSRIWLDGTTNVHAWHCAGGGLAAEFEIDAPTAALEERLDAWERGPSGSHLGGPGEVPVSWHARMALRIPIAVLDCGNAAMERDMRQALRAGAYPVIAYRFGRVREARFLPVGPVPAFLLEIEGEISLAGTSRPIVVEVTATRIAARRFRLRGGLPLRMTDFGIPPPVALFGLIRARDELWVSVDLEFRLPEEGRAAAAGD